MDEKLQRQLIRQLKILNFWITTLGVLLLIALSIIAFVLFQTVSAIKNTTDKIRNLEETAASRVDVQKQLCSGTGAVSSFAKQANLCN